MEDIAAATLEDARKFFTTYYTPNNTVLSVVGDIQPEDALERIAAWFGEIPAGPRCRRWCPWRRRWAASAGR